MLHEAGREDEVYKQGQVLRTEIRIDVRLIEAPSFGQTVFYTTSGPPALTPIVGWRKKS
jgi:hypothetical protein